MGTTPLETYYTSPDIKFHFPYEAFQWLPLLPPQWIHLVVGALALAGVMMAVGFCYRAATVTVFLTWGYLFAVESTRTYWQSHFYLELLLVFLMIWMPAGRTHSVDSWLAKGRSLPRCVPYWTILLLRGQLVIAYFYAGVAKLNADWLADAVPVRWFLARPGVTAPFEPHLTATQFEFFKKIIQSPEFAYLISYTGVVFDLGIGFLLLVRRTRIFGMVLMILFHTVNHFLIFDDIGWFPLVGITTALIFLDSDWPERWSNWFRHPRFTKPDWKWFAAGAILFPLAGGALGWRSKRSSRAVEAKGDLRLGRCVAPFVVVWLVWQTLMPIRHYFIRGDARLNYEGLSFSWRLKSETRHAFGHQLFVKDAKILFSDANGRTRIDWNEWRGEKVLYRKILPGRLNWRWLPEIGVLLEPLVGERIVYNPFGSPNPVQTEAQARDRATRIWQELYGQPPQAIHPAVTLSQALGSASEALRAAGHRSESEMLAGWVSRIKQIEQNELDPREEIKTRGTVRSILNELHRRDEIWNILAPIFQTVNPFTLNGERPLPAPFLLIEDPRLFPPSRERAGSIDTKVWRSAPYTRNQTRAPEPYAGEQLVIYTGELGGDARDMLPQACIFDSLDDPQRPSYIYWNSLKDLTFSKFIHVSNQAFYLRRYARRVAGLWEMKYGRRPVVNALTYVSLNGRPHQLLVDPEADLASVSVSWFRHNPWIKDLETARIPRDALIGASGTVGQ